MTVSTVLAGCFVFCLHRWFRSPTKVAPSSHHAPPRRIRPRERDGENEKTRLLKDESSEELTGESESGESDKNGPAEISQQISSTPVDAEPSSDKSNDKVNALSARRPSDSYGSTDITEVENIKPSTPLVTTSSTRKEKDDVYKDRSGVAALVEDGLLEPSRSKEDQKGNAESTVTAEVENVEPALLEAVGSAPTDLEESVSGVAIGALGAAVFLPAKVEDNKKPVGIPYDEEGGKRSSDTVISAQTDIEATKGDDDILSAPTQAKGKAGMPDVKEDENIPPVTAGAVPAETTKESVANELIAPVEPTLGGGAQKEEQEAAVDTQTVPRLSPPPKVSPRPSPLPRPSKPAPSPRVAPKPSPRPKRPTDSSTTADPSAPAVPDKPVVQPRKLPQGAVPLFALPKGAVPVFPGVPKGAVPVLPVGGGFPTLRKTARGVSDDSSEVQSGRYLGGRPWIGNGSSAGTEWEGEISISFEEVHLCLQTH